VWDTRTLTAAKIIAQGRHIWFYVNPLAPRCYFSPTRYGVIFVLSERS